MTIKRKTVYVVTGLELGWDCVVAVYDADEVDIKDLCEEYGHDVETGENDGHYVIHEQTIRTKLDR
jgi:hypothetical protein